jgi:Cu-processing system ATP-binding protein
MSASVTLLPDARVELAVRGLTKRFGSRRVLDELDVSFTAGAVTALLGPNGAGKTTLLKSLLGLVRPTAGTVSIDGVPLDERGDARRLIGYMPQLPHLPPHMTARELTAMLDDLRDFDRDPDEDLVDSLELRSDLDQPFRSLSGGTRQKVNATLAFRYRAPVLILDEPTAGLDPAASLALKDKIGGCRAEGRTVIVTSHNLGDLEAIADAVVFLLDGRARFAGTLDALLDATGHATLEQAIAAITAEGKAGPGSAGRRAAHTRPDHPHMEIVR